MFKPQNLIELVSDLVEEGHPQTRVVPRHAAWPIVKRWCTVEEQNETTQKRGNSFSQLKLSRKEGFMH